MSMPCCIGIPEASRIAGNGGIETCGNLIGYIFTQIILDEAKHNFTCGSRFGINIIMLCIANVCGMMVQTACYFCFVKNILLNPSHKKWFCHVNCKTYIIPFIICSNVAILHKKRQPFGDGAFAININLFAHRPQGL